MQHHPKGTSARVLLTSVFGPYAQDDQFGSRSINPMELYHNQVTRAQGAFSLRMFHRSWGIMMIQANIAAPCTVLDFPSREAFARELTANQYDVVGISSIIVNVGKVREMCRMVRQLSPESKLPFTIRKSFPASTPGSSECACPIAKVPPPRPSFLPSAAPWDVTSARPRLSSAAKASS